jgi:hypothetical protein
MRRRDRIGRVRWRLWEMLMDAGFPIPGPECLWMQEGAYRSWHWDLARWGARWIVPGCSAKSTPLPQSLYSWDRMTDCVRFGFTVNDDAKTNTAGGIEINAKDTKAEFDARKVKETA